MRKIGEEYRESGGRRVKYFTVLCEKHNTINSVYSSSFKKGFSGCKECTSENKSNARREDPEQALEEVVSLGWIATGNTEMRKSGNRQRLYVEVVCPNHAGTPVFKSMNNLRNGSGGCRECCSNSEPDRIYVLDVIDRATKEPVGVKYGITHRLVGRLSDLRRTSGFDFRLRFLMICGCSKVTLIEDFVRRTHGGGDMSKSDFGCGYTETLTTVSVEDVIQTIEEITCGN